MVLIIDFDILAHSTDFEYTSLCSAISVDKSRRYVYSMDINT